MLVDLLDSDQVVVDSRIQVTLSHFPFRATSWMMMNTQVLAKYQAIVEYNQLAFTDLEERLSAVRRRYDCAGVALVCSHQKPFLILLLEGGLFFLGM